MILTKQQTLALEMVKNHKISILTGSPGTGKTTIIKVIVDYIKEQNCKILLATPTGKSAQVMASACSYEANTIHRMLRPIPVKINGKLQFQFSYNVDNNLDCDFLAIDEVSMIDNGLMASLLSAINPNETKLLLIGDSNQLPSISPGNVLHDLIACGSIPYVELTEVFRHAGEIIKFCSAIRLNKPYDLPKTLDVDTGQNYIHVECNNPQVIHDTIVKLATVNMPKRNYNATKDVQILSPVNSKTVLSCDTLNESIQTIVNPQVPQDCIDNSVFRLGSKVINTKNIYDAVSASDEDDFGGEKEILLNGDMGTIVDLRGTEKAMVVKFQNPDRKILISKYRHYLKLAYALTIHRAQGSQFPVVIMPVHSTFAYNYNRALLYTAVSRAQEILITVGQKSAIRQAVKSVGVYNRKTMLIDKIEDKLLDSL